jgi:hypothetical protein
MLDAGSDPMTTNSNPTRRRWFQFGLGTMFLVVTVFAIWLGYKVNWMHERHQFIAQEKASAEARSVPVSFDSAYSKTRAPGLLWTLHEPGYWAMFVIAEGDSESALTSHDYERLRIARRLFPEAKITAVHHVERTDGSSTTSLSDPTVD